MLLGRTGPAATEVRLIDGFSPPPFAALFRPCVGIFAHLFVLSPVTPLNWAALIPT